MKTRNTLTLSGFGGVDFSSSPLNVASSRSPDAVNLIGRDGLNHKRHGWNELFRIEDADGNYPRINAVFPYDEGDTEVLLLHAGNGFYRACRNGGGYSVTRIQTPDGVTVRDERSEAFPCKGRLYITGCGDYLVYGTWDGGEQYELRRVYGDEDTYIPTTTVMISAENPDGSPLDDPNLLTDFRKNTLVGGELNQVGVFTLKLDAKVKDGTHITLEINMKKSETEWVTETYKTVYTVGTYDNTYLYKDGDQNNTILCYLYLGQELKFRLSCPPKIENTANITVTFQADTEDRSELVRGSRFGAIFGANGFSDRLFLAGNDEAPATDFYSAIDDFTYFSASQNCDTGAGSGAITGYLRMSDGTLAVFKDEKRDAPSVYFRTGSYTKDTDADGNFLRFAVEFQNTAGPVDVKQISRTALSDFYGDKLILTQNGVFALTLSDNVSTVERYLRNRSWSVAQRLKKESGLSDAVSVVFEGKYFLCVDHRCYVADKNNMYNDPSGSISYEWWYLENIPARVFYTSEDDLFFGTDDGRFCVFDTEYADRTYFYTKQGDLTVQDGKIVYSKKMETEPQAGDRVIFDGSVYGLLFDAEEMSVNRCRVTVSPENIGKIVEGDTVYADCVGASGLSVGTEYKISDVDRAECSFLLSLDGTDVHISAAGFRLCRKLSGKELSVYESDGGNCVFSLSIFGAEIPVADYNGSYPDDLLGRFCRREPVTARWYTPLLSLGEIGNRKTLLSVTAVSDPTVSGETRIGYETANALSAFGAKGLDSFSFERFNFFRFSFRPQFASSYTKKVVSRNFTFIRFFFESDTENDCAVCALEAVYKINQKNRGVR